MSRHVEAQMIRFTLSTLLLAAALGAPVAAAERPRGVIELFTSQGCSSCPPADRLMGELARDPSLVALSFAVTYWDYLGWRDTLASTENTERQQAYAEARGDRQVYTPQMVVDGVWHAVGSDRDEIAAKVAKRGMGKGAQALTVPVSIERKDGKLNVVIGGATAPVPAAHILLVTFERERSVAIGRGENEGTTVTYYNIVRTMKECATFNGAATTLQLDAPADANLGAAVLVQAVGNGQAPGVILGAAQLR